MTTIGGALIDSEMATKMKVVDLKRELKSRNLSTVGTKIELLERLKAATECPEDVLAGVEWEPTSLESHDDTSADAPLPDISLTLTEGMAHTALLDASETECPRTPDRPYPGIEVSQDMPFITAPESTTATVPLVRSAEVDIDQNLTSFIETITGLKAKANGGDTMNNAVNRTYAQRLGELEKSMNERIQRLEDGARRDDPNLWEEVCHLRNKVAELELRVEKLEKKPRSPSTEMELNPAAVEAIYEIRNSTDVGKETEDEVSEGSHTDLTRCQQTDILSALRNTGTQCDTDDFQGSPHNSEAIRDCTVKFAPEKHVRDIAEKRMDSIQPTVKEEQIRPPPGIQREIIIAGDGNVARIARALIEEVRAPQSLEFVMNRTATTQVVHELLETYEEQARNVPRLYILQVGVNDILRGEQPEAIVERLRMKWTNRKASLAICSVPESDRRGKRIHAATMLLNARLKQLCKSIKARFIDLSRELTSKRAMQKDGLQYGEEGIRVVTERLGAVASRFLGLRRRDKVGSQYQSDPWRYGSYPQMGRTEMSQKKCVTYDIPGMTVGPPHIGVPHVKDLRLKTQVKGHQPPLSNQPEYMLQPQSEQLSQVPTFPEIGVPLIPVHQSGGMTGPRVTMQDREIYPMSTLRMGLPTYQESPLFPGYVQHQAGMTPLEVAQMVNRIVRQQLAGMQC
ncbi:hypothetical protein ISCGN_023287 [Ixodes scapularis]